MGDWREMKQKTKIGLKRGWILYAMLLFPLLWYFLVCYVPMFGIVMAFQKFSVYKGIWGSSWVGFKNFEKFLKDPYFWQVLKNTFMVGFTNFIVNFPLPIIVALMFNELRTGKFKKIAQTISYLPHFVSVVALVSIMTSLLSPTTGVVNGVIKALNGKSVYFMMEPGWFRPIYILLGAWRGTGWGTIIYLAAMSGVDPLLYEVAEIDGANRFQRIWNITLPSIKSTVVVLFIMAVPGIFGADFETVLLLQQPLTMNVSDVISTYVYRRGLQDHKYDYATAMNLVFSIFSMIVVYICNRIARKKGGMSLW